MNPGSAARLERLITALRDPRRYPHAASCVEVIETHISVVLLAGEYAYKIKKPLDLGFLDFSTLAARQRCCEQELRLNRRTAPQLYLDVVPITGTAEDPTLAGNGTAFEYAVKMRRFPDDALLDRRARNAQLDAGQIDALADAIAHFHRNIAPAPADTPFGMPEHVLAPALENFAQIEALGSGADQRGALQRLRAWTEAEFASQRAVFALRRADGFVRECHGDLHLGNIALVEGRMTPFDGIEFNEDLRWIDVMNEMAFLAMDLLDHRLAPLAWRCLNRYLERTGDYGGLRVLRFYLVYRAMVRAKIALIRAAQEGLDVAGCRHARSEFGEYLALAQMLALPAPPLLVITHGLSGSGKTIIAGRLLEAIGMVRIRSDVERKRLAGLAAEASSMSGFEQGAYSVQSTLQTYAVLLRLARAVLAAGFPAIVDAAFLKHSQRAPFRSLGVPCVIIDCRAPHALLRSRVVARAAGGGDASEATPQVLALQIAVEEPLSIEEQADAVIYDSAAGEAAAQAVVAACAARSGPHRFAPAARSGIGSDDAL